MNCGSRGVGSREHRYYGMPSCEHEGGLGRAMLVDALSRAMTAADAIGARAMLVHAIDEDAVAFYRKFGFEPSPLDPKQPMLLMKDLRATLQSVGLG